MLQLWTEDAGGMVWIWGCGLQIFFVLNKEQGSGLSDCQGNVKNYFSLKLKTQNQIHVPIHQKQC